MHIPRQELRKILLQKLSDLNQSSDKVRWNMKLISLENEK